MFFKDIIGQDTIIEQLIKGVQKDKIPHAQMFCGNSGIGKMQLAIAYARYICCTNRTDHDACGKCSSCIKFNKLVHPDVHFMFPVIKKGTSDDYISEFRALLLEQPYINLNYWHDKINASSSQSIIYNHQGDEIIKKLNFKPFESDCKIALIWLPEKMNKECANKLLKILEEPPTKTYFILISDHPDELLPTIRSRVQTIYVKPIGTKEMAEVLQKQFQLTTEDSHKIAKIAKGDFTKALDVISLNETKSTNLELFISVMRLAYQRKLKEIKQWSEEVSKMGREQNKEFLLYCQRMIRENFIYNFHQEELTYMTTKEEAFAKNFAPFINERNIIQLNQELNEAQKHIEQNVNAKMVFFDLALRMIVLLKK